MHSSINDSNFQPQGALLVGGRCLRHLWGSELFLALERYLERLFWSIFVQLLELNCSDNNSVAIDGARCCHLPTITKSQLRTHCHLCQCFQMVPKINQKFQSETDVPDVGKVPEITLKPRDGTLSYLLLRSSSLNPSFISCKIGFWKCLSGFWRFRKT